MKRLLIILVLLWPVLAGAAAFDCTPLTQATLHGTGTRAVLGSLPAGRWSYWWCPVGTPYADGKPSAWRLQTFAVLHKYESLGPGAWLDLAWQVMNQPDPLATINASVQAGQIIPTDPQEVYDFAMLKRAACLDAATPPYIADVLPLPANFCGAAPTPPGPTVTVWQVPASGSTLYTTANGARTGLVAGRRAPPNATCDCTTQIPVGTSTYCPLVSAPASEVALCKKVTP